MITLGIETSCDETAASVVHKRKILSNVVSSSAPLHEKYGGVIPEIASRFHIEYINHVVRTALKKARKNIKDVELVAVTEKPGLPGSLLTGISFANALSYALGRPRLGIDHLEAHLYANFLTGRKPMPQFPFIGAVVSGGHTNIFICKSFGSFTLIGQTKDDAVGEAFDKVAKILNIGYPGGPRIERHAKRFIPPFGPSESLTNRLARRVGITGEEPIRFPRSFLDKDSFDFSLSGIKTAVFYYVKTHNLSNREIARISWSFQEAVFSVLAERIVKACKKFRIKEILLGGGVISNERLRAKLNSISQSIGYKLFYPPASLCVDNAAMVAGLGEELYKRR